MMLTNLFQLVWTASDVLVPKEMTSKRIDNFLKSLAFSHSGQSEHSAEKYKLSKKCILTLIFYKYNVY